MLNAGKRMLLVAMATGLAMASGGALGRAPLAQPVTVPRERPKPNKKKKKGRSVLSRFGWSRYQVPLGGGAREVARRRRQIEAGTLLTTEGQKRLRGIQLGPVGFGVDWGSGPDETAYFKVHSGRGTSESPSYERVAAPE